MNGVQLGLIDLIVIGGAGFLICLAVWEALIGKGKR